MELVKTYPNSLGKLMCDNIIKIFNETPDKKNGITGSGLNKVFKDTTDLHSNDMNENKDLVVSNTLKRNTSTLKKKK